MITFCERWFRRKKRIIGPIKVEDALKLEKEGNPYTVIIGNPQHPDCFIEINSGSYGVSFLDEFKRDYFRYTFKEESNGMLFLYETIFREYNGESDSILTGTIYWFSPDGKVKIEKSKAPFKKAELIEKETDVSKNWEKKPEFGKYDNLIKKER